jgi:hypothetical protein
MKIQVEVFWAVTLCSIVVGAQHVVTAQEASTWSGTNVATQTEILLVIIYIKKKSILYETINFKKAAITSYRKAFFTFLVRSKVLCYEHWISYEQVYEYRVITNDVSDSYK